MQVGQPILQSLVQPHTGFAGQAYFLSIYIAIVRYRGLRGNLRSLQENVKRLLTTLKSTDTLVFRDTGTAAEESAVVVASAGCF